ncbi:serine/threonine-protein kinase Kist-like [Ptychodera flava]|uniref:serine/threonine-protein kinase Kist-like n=1 Tax=Ptychodera flava TaxID=63121 RepID=UPI00396AABED
MNGMTTSASPNESPDFEVGEVLNQQWRIVRKLGKGACSVVYEAKTSDNSASAAIKVYKYGDKYLPVYYREIQIIRQLNAKRDHPGIVTLYNWFTHKGYPCLVFEVLYCKLQYIISKNNEEGLSLYAVQFLGRQILETLAYMHGKGVVHADIKPANIMWCPQTGSVKLIDFGLSIELDDKDAYHQVQSLCYQCPETKRLNYLIADCSEYLDETVLSCLCTSAIDVWTVGCILSFLYTGQKLYSKDDVPQLGCSHCQAIDTTLKCKCAALMDSVFKPRESDADVADRTKIVEDLTSLTKSLLQCKASQRPTAKEALQHPFFQHDLNPSYQDFLLFPTRILRLLNTVDQRDLDDDAEYQDICDDIKSEVIKHGNIKKLVMPREGAGAEKVFIEFEDAGECTHAQSALMGKYFNGRTVITTFFPVKSFESEDYF